jgi:uncharacterized protein involved in exopolysaccharide biosynthesis
MASSVFNLVEVKESIRQHLGAIITFSIASALIGTIVYLVTPKKYEAKTDFLIRNPLYSDRNYIYNYDTKFLDYFGNEEDANRVIMFAGSDLVQKQVIRNMNLAKVYKLDTTKPKQLLQLERKFDKNLSILRNENKDLLLTYTDTKAERAADVANECVRILEQTYEDFYGDMRKGMYQSIMNKIVEEDSIIISLTDTLAKLREKYGIYDIISPSRHNLMNGNMKENSHKNYGLGIELVQNIESLKDEIVADRAVKTTLANQYSSSYSSKQNNIKLPILKVITYAKPPVTPKGLGGMVTLIVCGLLGFLFSTIFILISDNLFQKTEEKK